MKNVLTIGLALMVASGAFASDALVQAEGQAKKRGGDAQKMQPLQALSARGVPVLNFELERVQTWN